MGVYKGLAGVGRSIIAVLLAGILGLGSFSCAKPTAPQALLTEPTPEPNRLAGPLEEVSPPETLQTLKQMINAYDPQVRILSPRPGEVVESTSVSVRFQVRGLPIFKDPKWGLGPHLHLFLDDEPYRAVYDLSEPLVLSDLAPGTHTLRVFASRPWHESFKNQGAFDQRTFHVFAQTPQKALDKNQPLLTYSRPQGSYGAEPILLDFYLTNAPLHAIAQETPQDNIPDWRIRCTVNGQSFVFDQWQPVYLKGFKPGQNWIQLELIDESGNLIDNAFNNTVRVITYEPGGEDTLSQLVRDELSLKQVAGIIDPTYTPPPEAAPEPELPTEPTELEPAPELEAPEAAPIPPVIPPAAVEQPAAEPPEAAPAEEPTVETPVEAAPTEAAPTEAAPTEAAPTEAAPAEAPTVEAPTAADSAAADLTEPEPVPSAPAVPEEDLEEEIAPEAAAPEAPEAAPAPASEQAIPESPADSVIPELSAPELPVEMAPPLSGSEIAPAAPGELPTAEPFQSPKIPDVLDTAPTSSRFLKDFKQWRQRYQKPSLPPEMAPSSGLREIPDDLAAPAPEVKADPEESLEAPVQTLPEIVVPPEAGTVEEPLDLIEPEAPADQADPPDERQPTPASPEQLLI
jgi:hypothetical protein